jgi:hypothetical protein
MLAEALLLLLLLLLLVWALPQVRLHLGWWL